MADWVQRTISRTLLGTSPSRWFKAFSHIVAGPGGLIYGYNGAYDTQLTNVNIYDNALFDLVTPASVTTATETQRNRSNWDHGASGNNVIELAANLTTPTMPDRHSIYGYCPDDGYLYFFGGLSQNITWTRNFAAAVVDTTNDWIDFPDNVSPAHTGMVVRASTSGGLPGGLAAATDYWFIRDGANRGGFATSYANAKAGTRINLTSQGTGTHTMTRQTNHPSDFWRQRVSSGAGQYVHEQLFPSGEQPYQVPGQTTVTGCCTWFPDLSAFVIMGYNTDGFTFGNRTTWLYYPATNTFERLASYTANAGGPLSGSPQSMAYDPTTDGGCVWFFGGESQGNALWKFKDDKTWTQITATNSHPSARVNHGVAFANGKLWIQGGETSGGTNIVDFWSYDPATNAFTQDTISALPTSANFTYMAFDGTHLVVQNNLLEVWTWVVPSGAVENPSMRRFGGVYGMSRIIGPEGVGVW